MKEKIYGLKESMKHSMEPYFCYDINDKKVFVQPKNSIHHSSIFPAQNDPHVFRNLECVITNPTRYYPSKSKTKETKARQERGDVVVYEKDNFYENINSTYRHTFPNRKMIVAVFYGKDGENYTLSFYDDIEDGDI